MGKTSNMNPALAGLYAAQEQIAYAWAMGKDSMSDAALRLFRAAVADESVTPDDAGPFYKSTRERASVIADTAHKAPIKVIEGDSLASQISKLAAHVKLACYARDNGDVEPVYVEARKLATGGYTKVTKCATALVKALAKNPTLDAATMRAIVASALDKAPDTASEVVRKLADQWEALAYGNEKTPAPFPSEFAALLASENVDLAKRIGESLARVAFIFEALEKARETPPALTA